jgi:hypothetical protein
VDATPGNASRIMRALVEFGAPMQDLQEADFAQPGVTYQIGLPPSRIDILTDLTALSFAETWPNHIIGAFGDLQVPFIDRASFVKNKRATGRPKDLADVEGIE